MNRRKVQQIGPSVRGWGWEELPQLKRDDLSQWAHWCTVHLPIQIEKENEKLQEKTRRGWHNRAGHCNYNLRQQKKETFITTPMTIETVCRMPTTTSSDLLQTPWHSLLLIAITSTLTIGMPDEIIRRLKVSLFAQLVMCTLMLSIERIGLTQSENGCTMWCKCTCFIARWKKVILQSNWGRHFNN